MQISEFIYIRAASQGLAASYLTGSDVGNMVMDTVLPAEFPVANCHSFPAAVFVRVSY